MPSSLLRLRLLLLIAAATGLVMAIFWWHRASSLVAQFQFADGTELMIHKTLYGDKVEAGRRLTSLDHFWNNEVQRFGFQRLLRKSTYSSVGHGSAKLLLLMDGRRADGTRIGGDRITFSRASIKLKVRCREASGHTIEGWINDFDHGRGKFVAGLNPVPRRSPTLTLTFEIKNQAPRDVKIRNPLWVKSAPAWPVSPGNVAPAADGVAVTLEKVTWGSSRDAPGLAVFKFSCHEPGIPPSAWTLEGLHLEDPTGNNVFSTGGISSPDPETGEVYWIGAMVAALADEPVWKVTGYFRRTRVHPAIQQGAMLLGSVDVREGAGESPPFVSSSEADAQGVSASLRREGGEWTLHVRYPMQGQEYSSPSTAAIVGARVRFAPAGSYLSYNKHACSRAGAVVCALDARWIHPGGQAFWRRSQQNQRNCRCAF